MKKKALQLIKVDSGVTLNEYPGALEQHRGFAEYYGLKDLPWYRRREQRILNVGLAEAYKKAPLEDRILSTDSVELPSQHVIDLSQPEYTPPAEAEAAGPAAAKEDTAD